jgi:hypothetical protein
MADELGAVAAYAAHAVQQRLRAREGWLGTAAAHAGSLALLTLSLSQFESSRVPFASDESLLGPSAGSGGQSGQSSGQGGSSHADNQFAPSWQQYSGLLSRMQAVHGQHEAARLAVSHATEELGLLQQAKTDALIISQSAQVGAGCVGVCVCACGGCLRVF